MSHVCCCGNELSPEPTQYRMTSSPCRCESPRGPRRQIAYGIPSRVSKAQYEERRKLGLPYETAWERGERTPWR